MRWDATALLAVVLTGIAGYVDAFGYLTLNQIYVANMSGNSVALGIHAAQLDWPQVVVRCWPILSYLCGLFASRFIVTFGIHRSYRSVAAPALSVQFLMLLAFMAWPTGPLGVFLAGAAMGIQAATVSRFHGVTVYTCFVTGTLVKLADNVAEVVSTLGHNWRGSLAASAKPWSPSLRKVIWFGSVWSFYVIGAAAGAWGLRELHAKAMFFPLSALVLLIAFDLRWPASFEEENRQPAGQL